MGVGPGGRHLQPRKAEGERDGLEVRFQCRGNGVDVGEEGRVVLARTSCKNQLDPGGRDGAVVCSKHGVVGDVVRDGGRELKPDL